MQAQVLIFGNEQGTLKRFSGVYWKDIKKGREVKRFMKIVLEELKDLLELRDGIVKEFGKDGRLSPTDGDWEKGAEKLAELYAQEIELPEAPKIDESHLATAEGFTIADFELLEDLGLLEVE